MIKNKRDGFTLIELIVVIAILAILVMIAVPAFANLIDRSRVSVDQSNLVILNQATTEYAAYESKAPDIFSGVSEDLARMQILIQNDFLTDVIEAKYTNAKFEWNIDAQKWLYSLFVVSLDKGDSYLFFEQALENFRKIGTWVKKESGFFSTYGLLFVDNPRSEYVIESKANIGSGNAGGYGILFETSLTDNNSDTGYSLQFDRGISSAGSVIIRPRDNGKEKTQSKNFTFDYQNSNGIILDQRTTAGKTWWESVHDIKMEVKKITGNTTQKNLSVWIDGKLLFNNYVFDTSIESANNFTGYRAWHTSGATFGELNISPLE